MRFDLLFDVAVGDGLGEAFFCFGKLSGAGVGVDFFFRCLRLGVGDGSETFLIFVPSDSSAGRAASMAPNKITRIRSHFITRCCSVRCPQRRIESSQLVGCAEDSARYSPGSKSAGRMPAARTGSRLRQGATACREMPVLRLRELLKNRFVQANAGLEIFERKIFVRRVSAAIG